MSAKVSKLQEENLDFLRKKIDYLMKKEGYLREETGVV